MRRLLVSFACAALLLAPAAVRAEHDHDHDHDHHHLWECSEQRTDLAVQTSLFAAGAVVISAARMCRRRREQGRG